MYLATFNDSTLWLWFHTLSIVVKLVHMRQKRWESLVKIFFVSNSMKKSQLLLNLIAYICDTVYLFIALVRTYKWLMYFFKMNDGIVIFHTMFLWTIVRIVKVRQKRYRSFSIHYEMKNKRKSKKRSKLDFRKFQKNHDFWTYPLIPDWWLRWNVPRDF